MNTASLAAACMLSEGNLIRDHNSAAHVYLRAIHNIRTCEFGAFHID